MRFPVPNWIAAYPFNTDMRRFGARRAGGKRTHAGCDLYAPLRSPVIAIAQGVVLDKYPFYNQSDAVEVDHGFPIGVIRYGEIKVAPGIGRGRTVKPGDVIGYITNLVGAGMNGIHPMCHLEQFAGWGKGPLTDRSTKGGKYQRREDVIDPTPLLMRLQVIELANPQKPAELEPGQKFDSQVFHRISETFVASNPTLSSLP